MCNITALRNTDQQQLGEIAEIQVEVTDADTAISFGPGDVPVLATPRLVALKERAACDALGELADEMTSVGVRIDVSNLAYRPVHSAGPSRKVHPNPQGWSRTLRPG